MTSLHDASENHLDTAYDAVFLAKNKYVSKAQDVFPGAAQFYWLPDRHADLIVGPTVADVNQVIETINSLSKEMPRVAAFGGARVLAATVVGSYLANRSNLRGEDAVRHWLERTTHSGEHNFVPPKASKIALSARVDVVPTSLLAVQASTAKTWIVNDPDAKSTYWGSHNGLRPSAAYFVYPFLNDLFRAQLHPFRNNLAIVLAVLVECVIYGRDPTKRAVAKQRLDACIRIVRSKLPALRDLDPRQWDDDFLRACRDVAINSRKSENVLGPAMPALALSQAVSRYAAAREAAVAGSEVIGRILPNMLDFGRRPFINELSRPECCEVARGLACDWPEFLHTDAHDAQIALRAAMQKLSKKIAMSADAYQEVLRRSREQAIMNGKH